VFLFATQVQDLAINDTENRDTASLGIFSFKVESAHVAQAPQVSAQISDTPSTAQRVAVCLLATHVQLRTMVYG